MASSLCPRCSTSLLSISGRFCPSCGQAILDEERCGNADVSAAFIPWEQVRDIGFIPAVVRTTANTLLKPAAFFKALVRSRDNGMALLYGLMAGSIGNLFGFLWYNHLFANLFSSLGDEAGGFFSPDKLLYSPATAMAGLVAATLYFQLLFILTRTRRKSMGSTFRILCYSQSSAILQIIPLIGIVASVCWGVWIMIIGFREIHGITIRRSMLLVLLPLLAVAILCTGMVIVLAIAGLLTSGFLKEIPALYR
jgi:hypothetical protein